MLQKMKEIQELQEKLTVKHFEIDQSKGMPDSASGTAMGEHKEDCQLMELTQALEKLGASIQSLHSKQSKKPVDPASKRVHLKPNIEEEVV